MPSRIAALVLLAILACPPLLGQAPQPIDGTIATVGLQTIYRSDVEMERMRTRLQHGPQAKEPSTCEVLEQYLVNALLLDQATLDSIQVTEKEVEPEVEQRLNAFIRQVGDEKTLEKQYGRSMRDVRRELLTLAIEQRKAQRVRSNIVGKVHVTPSEVREFFTSLPHDSIPMVSERYTYRQLCLLPLASEKAKFEVRERLLALRERILKGERFPTLAVAYSEDRASAIKGGEMGYLPRESFVKPFADAAFALHDGQVSQIVETEYGYHIIQLIGRKGDLVNVRHILLKPNYTPDMLQSTTLRLDSIRTRIVQDSISFEQACATWSNDQDTYRNGGLVPNPYRGGSLLDRESMIPIDYYELKKLQPGEISKPFESRDLKGNVMIKIIKLERIIPSHQMNLELDYADIQELAKRVKEQQLFDEWLTRKQKSVFISIDPQYEHCEFHYPFWRGKFAAQ